MEDFIKAELGLADSKVESLANLKGKSKSREKLKKKMDTKVAFGSAFAEVALKLKTGDTL